MNTEPTTTHEATRIRETDDGGRRYVLHPENDDLFVRTGKQVIEACRLGISIEVWFDEFRSMLDHLKTWSQQHAQAVWACHAAPRGSKIGLFFVPCGESYDFDLADELTELSTQLGRFNIGTIEILQIPEQEIDRFIDPQAASLVYEHDRAAPQAMAT